MWVVAWLLLASALLYSFGPTPPGVDSFRYADKVFHAATYLATVFAFLLAAVWRPGRGPGTFPESAVWIVLGAIATGFGVELLQGAFFGRNAELADGIADLLGVAFGSGLWLTLRVVFPSGR